MTALICIIWVIFKFYTNLGSLRTWNMICSQSPMSTGNTWKDFMHSHTYTFIHVAWLHFPALWLHASTVSQLSNELKLLRASHPELCQDERQTGQRQCIICAGVKRGGERRGRSHPWWEDWGMMKGKHSSIGRYWKLVGAGLFFSLERKTFLWTLNSSKKCWQLLMNMSALCEELLKKWSSELNQHWDVVFFHKNCEC